ncbi:hypothetical protein Z043_112438, partial [Scleropages formosus]
TQMAPQTPGSVTDVASVSQERGFMASMQRNPPMPSQFGPQPPGQSMSPHPSPGAQMHHGMGSYPQSSASSSYGPQGVQYGPQESICGPAGTSRESSPSWISRCGRFVSSLTRCCGSRFPAGNYPRPATYAGAPGANYSGPGHGMSNSLGLNSSSPMHGQGPGQPCVSVPMGRSPGPTMAGRPYPSGLGSAAPSSPGMPQTTGPGMGPPAAGVNRKAQETVTNAMQATANSTQGRPPFARSPAYLSQTGPGPWVTPPATPQPPHLGSPPLPSAMPQYEQYG